MAKDTSVSTKVTGLREVNLALNQISAQLPAELKAELLLVADKVAGVAQQRTPWLTGAAARSIVAHSTAQGASIAEGGRAAPYMPWLDFGGSTGRGHRPGVKWSGSIIRPWMGKPVGIGSILYPAIKQEAEAIIEGALEAVDKVAHEAGFETRG